MRLILSVLYLVTLLFIIVLLVRLVYDWVQTFARLWKPRGFSLLVAEIVYSVSDPPLKIVRKFVPPLRFGGISLDVAFFLVLVLSYVFLSFFVHFLR